MLFRTSLQELENAGFLNRIRHPVDWKFELGEIARKNRFKPLLFDNIKGYNNARLFTGGMSSRGSVAISIGLNKSLKKKEIISVLKNRISKPIIATLQDETPNYELSYLKNVNLFDLPVPWWHRQDGGRYLGTWHINVSKDPFTGKRNVGVYRMKIIDAHHSSISVSSGGHLGRHVRNAERLGKDLQVAVAIGVAEPVVMAAAAALPFGSDEYDFAGALQGESLNLVKCRNTDLEVPADAEYVLEGIIKYGAKVVDGPYMDYSGKISINPDAFLFEVKSIACKADPIFRGMSVGGPGAEDHQLLSILSHLGLVDFHSSQVRQKMQNFFLKHEFFRLFQYAGRCGGVLKKLR